MKLEKINAFAKENNINLKGKRVLKNAVEQLSKNNPYSLTATNQRYIANSIKELSKVGDEKTINFLLNVAAESKYSTNIVLEDAPKNNWKAMLVGAAAIAASLITTNLPQNIAERIQKLLAPQKLNETERDIILLREQLLDVVNLEQINNETKGATKNFERNLDYLIVSSETTLEHKKYILERLNYFMSNDYEINPQLADKKSIAVAEMVNDMAISAPGNEIPNIKAVNQKQHGMCAAISIVRKKLAYEDKPNYIDSIISELDSSDSIEAYDRNALGTGKKVKLEKIPVDFNTALANGYRIIDASTTHWMQIAQMSGVNNFSLRVYNPFDNENFGVKTDSFLNAQVDNENLSKIQAYYQNLLISKSLVEDYKTSTIKKSVEKQELKNSKRLNQTLLIKTQDELKNVLKNNLLTLSQSEINILQKELLSLEKPNSNKIKSDNQYSYIPNEEAIIKQEKIKKYIYDKTSNVLEKETITKIFNLVESINSLDKAFQVGNNSKSANLNKSKKLFEIAAAHRNQVISSLEDKLTLENVSLNLKIPSKERLIIEHIDNLIEKLETNSANSELILNQVAEAFVGYNPNKEEILEALQATKATVNKILTEGLDNIYLSLALEGKKGALISYINEIISAIDGGNNKSMKAYADVFNVKKNKNSVLKVLNNYIARIKESDEKEFAEIFEKFGLTSQIEYAHKIFEGAKIEIESQEAPTEEDVAIKEQVVQQMKELEKNILYYENFLENCADSLRILDNNGDILYSGSTKDAIIKKSEQKGDIASAKELKELQVHFEKVAQDRSSDEFQSRQGKLKDKGLYEFSNSEKRALDNTEKNINAIYSYILKSIAGIRKDKKEEFEEINRAIGVNSGKYWIMEGGSGLYNEEEVRILEYMTGRPHYISDNIGEAIEKIKTSPYSGISSSSVFHDRFGMHAQYIADIKPVKVTVKDKNGKNSEEIQEVLYHDNTWGASENENTWIDSYGLKRTDYSDNRGGSLGYITNDEYQNGNFVNRILNDMIMNVKPEIVDNKIYKKIKGESSEVVRTPQYRDVILDGSSPGIKSVSDQIHDTFLLSNIKYLDIFGNTVKDMTEEEVIAKITDLENARNLYKPIYKELKDRILPKVGKGITTKQEYDKLANDDYLKVVLEKMALKERGETKTFSQNLAKVKNVKDLSKYKAIQTKQALDLFRYIFRKDCQIMEFIGDEAQSALDNKVESILEKYGIKLTEDEFLKLGGSFDLNIDLFDGSVKKSIELITERLNTNVNSIIKDKNAADEIMELYANYFDEQFYFNKSDLDMSSLNNQEHAHVIKFIDRIYDPADDEEFVQIFRKLQDMTLEEFNNEVMPNVTHEDLGLKNITGFEMLQKIQKYDDKSNYDFLNTIFYDSYVENFVEPDKKEGSSSYTYSKFSRRSHKQTVLDFNYLYKAITDDLSLLRMPRIFDKYKGTNLKRHDAYPAYPTPDYLSDEYINISLGRIIEGLKQNSEMIRKLKFQLEDYNAAKRLLALAAETKNQEFFTEENYDELTVLVGDFITHNLNDPALQSALDSADLILELDIDTPRAVFLPHIKNIAKVVGGVEKMVSKESIQKLIKEKRIEIEVDKKALTKASVQPRYNAKFQELLTQFEQALKKGKREEAATLEGELFKRYREYHILEDEKALVKQFLLAHAKDSKLSDYKENYKNIIKHGLNQSELAEVQYIVMDAVSEGIALNSKNAFNNHILSTGEKMGKDNIICSFVNELIDGQNLDAALLFIEKMGFADTYVNYMVDGLKWDNMRNAITNAFDLANNFTKFQNAIEPHFEYIEKNLQNPDFPLEKEITKLENLTKKQAKDCKLDKRALQVLIKGYETLKYNLQTPNSQKDMLYYTIISSAKSDCASVIQEAIEYNDNILNGGYILLNLINRILLKVDSEASKNRETINQRFQELYDYKESLANLQQNQ